MATNPADIEQCRANFLAGRPIDEGLVRPAVLDAWTRSRQLGFEAGGARLPPQSANHLELLSQNKRRVVDCMGSIVRRIFAPERSILERFHIAAFVIVDVGDDLIVYGKSGDTAVLADLQAIGLDVGTSFSEASMGATAVSESLRTEDPLWFVGAENYLEAFGRYALFAQFEFTDTEMPLSIAHADFAALYVVPLEFYSQDVRDIVRLALDSKTVVTKMDTLPQITIKDHAFDSFLHRNEIAIIVTNKHDLVIDVNQQCERLLGLGYLESCGQPYFELIPELSELHEQRQAGRRVAKVLLLERTRSEIQFEIEPAYVKGRYLGAIIYATDAAKLKQDANAVLDLRAHFTFDDVLGTNPAFLRMKRTAQTAAQRSSSVLICGEGGTGKELLAHAIHNAGPRKDRPFVVVNCGGIIDEMIDSTLFGNVERVFSSDQTSESIGKIEQAEGGTLFLNGVDELPLHTQSILASALRTKTTTRLGGTRARSIDVRIIASCQPDIIEKVNSESFRSDLYYLLNVIKLDTIPLRERIDDLPVLAKSYLTFLNGTLGKHFTGITSDAVAYLQSYSWPGNVRELQNTLERSADLETGDKITCNFLSKEIKGLETAAAARPTQKPASAAPAAAAAPAAPRTFQDAEEARIKELMRAHNGNKTKVAAELGITRATLYRRLKRITDWS